MPKQNTAFVYFTKPFALASQSFNEAVLGSDVSVQVPRPLNISPSKLLEASIQHFMSATWSSISGERKSTLSVECANLFRSFLILLKSSNMSLVISPNA